MVCQSAKLLSKNKVNYLEALTNSELIDDCQWKEWAREKKTTTQHRKNQFHSGKMVFVSWVTEKFRRETKIHTHNGTIDLNNRQQLAVAVALKSLRSLKETNKPMKDIKYSIFDVWCQIYRLYFDCIKTKQPIAKWETEHSTKVSENERGRERERTK